MRGMILLVVVKVGRVSMMVRKTEQSMMMTLRKAVRCERADAPGYRHRWR